MWISIYLLLISIHRILISIHLILISIRLILISIRVIWISIHLILIPVYFILISTHLISISIHLTLIYPSISHLYIRGICISSQAIIVISGLCLQANFWYPQSGKMGVCEALSLFRYFEAGHGSTFSAIITDIHLRERPDAGLGVRNISEPLGKELGS